MGDESVPINKIGLSDPVALSLVGFIWQMLTPGHILNQYQCYPGFLPHSSLFHRQYLANNDVYAKVIKPTALSISVDRLMTTSSQSSSAFITLASPNKGWCGAHIDWQRGHFAHEWSTGSIGNRYVLYIINIICSHHWSGIGCGTLSD